MLLETGLKIVFSSIGFFAMFIFCFALFRFPIRYHYKKMIAISSVTSCLSYYFRGNATLMGSSVLIVLMVQIILIMLMIRLPFFYAAIMLIFGTLAGVLSELVPFGIGTVLEITSYDQVQNSMLDLFIETCISCSLLFMLAVFLLRQKIGFMFMAKHFSLRSGLAAYNFLISGVLFVALVIMQYLHNAIQAFSPPSFLLCAMTFSLLLALVITYRFNKKIITEKYKRLKNG